MHLWAAGTASTGCTRVVSHYSYLVSIDPWDGGDRVPIPVRYRGS
jgi:hypothetical protein